MVKAPPDEISKVEPEPFSCHAFEYVGKPFTPQRTAELRHGNRLYIVSANSLNGQVRKGKDGYYSTKHNGKGIGLASIAAIVEKHQGAVQISNSRKEFLADVVLKV